MINLDEIKIDEVGAKEIIDFVHDVKFNPKNQQKYFFDEAMSYYKELCKISKQIVDFQEAFKAVYANEKEIANNAVSVSQLNEALASLKSHVDEEISSIETQLSGKLINVEITGTGFIPGESYIENGVKHIEMNVASEAGGTVTSITAGNGLTGGTIMGAGTIAIDPTIVAMVTTLNNYVAKADAPGYDDILTKTEASSDYVAKEDAEGYDDILTEANAATTYVAKADAPGYADILTKTEAANEYASKSTIRNNISVSVTPTALGTPQLWDSTNYYGYSADITISGISASTLIENMVLDTALMNKIAPFIDTKANAITVYTHTNESLVGIINVLVTREV